MRGLEGKVVLITGSASGIGAATARRFSEEGATVAVSDIQDEMGEQVAAGIRDAGGRASYHRLDVTDEAAWGEVISAVVDEHGGLDVLVNNAGIGDLLTLEETPLEDYERTIAITQTSVFLGMKAAAGALKDGGGAVINISSIFGASGGFGTSPAYHAAKGAVRIMTKSTALNWATQGVRVNSVHPGFTDTPILDVARGTEAEDAMTAMTPMGRLGQPEEIAAAVAFLASDDAAFVTGSEVYVDGGFMAR